MKILVLIAVLFAAACSPETVKENHEVQPEPADKKEIPVAEKRPPYSPYKNPVLGDPSPWVLDLMLSSGGIDATVEGDGVCVALLSTRVRTILVLGEDSIRYLSYYNDGLLTIPAEAARILQESKYYELIVNNKDDIVLYAEIQDIHKLKQDDFIETVKHFMRVTDSLAAVIYD